jgi:hypothetical protein
MEKIILKALSLAGFQNAEEITRVISNTPNPMVAAEIILGVYTPYVLDTETRFKRYKYNTSKEFVEILDIDELANVVKYNIYNQKTKWVHYVTREDKQAGIYHEVKQSGIDYYDSGHVPMTGYTVNERTDNADSFNSNYNTQISVDDADNTVAQWNSYGITVEEVIM